MLATHKPWWSALLTGSIRVPAPIAVAFAAAFLVMGSYLLRARAVPPPPAAAPTVDLSDFRPVADPHVRIVMRRYETR